MDTVSVDAFTAAMRPATVDLYTAAYRVTGRVRTRFSRVAEIMNQHSSTHVAVEEATISEHADPQATVSAPSALVALDEILLVVAPALDGAPRPEMRIQKRSVLAQLAIPPFRVTGAVHVSQGSRPADGLLNSSDRFIAITDATIGCGQYPELGRSAAAVAVRRDRAHIVLVADDEAPDQLLADVLDQRTAESWLTREPDQAI